jgi:hypothetical protein
MNAWSFTSPYVLKMSGYSDRLQDARLGLDFALLHSVHTGSGAHQASYPMSTRGSVPGKKAAVA